MNTTDDTILAEWWSALSADQRRTVRDRVERNEVDSALVDLTVVKRIPGLAKTYWSVNPESGTWTTDDDLRHFVLSQEIS